MACSEDQTAQPATDSGKVSRAEIVNGIVIAVAGLLISWAAYEADLWSGEEDLNFSRANILYTQAARTWDRANAQQAVEVQLFSHWLDAALHKDTTLAAFYADHLPPEARGAFKAWLALDPLRNPGAPSSPLQMPEYAPSGPVKAAALEEQGDRAFHEGRRARRVGDSYAQAGAVLSTSLFFAGIGQIFSVRRMRYVLTALAVVACALGVLRLATLPLMTLQSASGG
jgi:hypothetical protein